MARLRHQIQAKVEHCDEAASSYWECDLAIYILLDSLYLYYLLALLHVATGCHPWNNVRLPHYKNLGIVWNIYLDSQNIE